MEFLANYGLFTLKLLTVIIGLLALIVGIVAITKKMQPKVSLESLSDDYESLQSSMRKVVDPDHKISKKEKKESHRKRRNEPLFL